jgi:membrane fusion protein, multidrug efflux system
VAASPVTAFHGRLESLGAATGAKFSLLPPDNATGNFTKVVQRVPVKIVFTDRPDAGHPLRVGMNVTVVVDLG